MRTEIFLLVGLIIGIIIRLYYQHYNNENVVAKYFSTRESIFIFGIIVTGLLIPVLSFFLLHLCTFKTPRFTIMYLS